MESWPNYDGGATGKRFYSYVNGDPINNVDPLGLWEVSAYAGDGAAAEINFGYNNGQWNFGAYGGVGVGAGVDYNGSPEAEQCQSPGIHELGVQAQAGFEAGSSELGLSGGEYAGSGSYAMASGTIFGYPIGSVTAENGQITTTNPGITGNDAGASAGGYAGVGGTYYGGGSGCSCESK